MSTAGRRPRNAVGWGGLWRGGARWGAVAVKTRLRIAFPQHRHIAWRGAVAVKTRLRTWSKHPYEVSLNTATDLVSPHS